MSDGVIIKNVAGLHKDKSADSELISQAIMGQTVGIEKDEGDWLYVQTWDTYHGWIQSRWVNRSIPKTDATVTSLFADALKTPNPNGEIWTKLVITTSLDMIDENNGFAHVRLPDGKEAWILNEHVSLDAGESTEIIQTAKRFLGVPYLWGGTTPFGLDCSGFVQLVYKIHNIMLLRDAHIQASDPQAIPVEKQNLMPGDLVFFAGGEKITHVGMACGDGTFIHSTGKGVGVTINSLDDEPYACNYVGGRRMLKGL